MRIQLIVYKFMELLKLLGYIYSLYRWLIKTYVLCVTIENDYTYMYLILSDI